MLDAWYRQEIFLNPKCADRQWSPPINRTVTATFLYTVYVCMYVCVMYDQYMCVCCGVNTKINPLNAELNPICHLLALLAAHHILHVSRIRVKQTERFMAVHKLQLT